MSTSTLEKIETLKEAGEDFEWYPTTESMIQEVSLYCKRHSIDSLLDVGAGDGRVLSRIQELSGKSIHLYAIEKSEIHINDMPPEVSIVGTDFLLQSLIDKDVDAIFCNPPYSVFEEWAVKVISEANAKHAFLILPVRWKDSAAVQSAITRRQATAKSVWSGDFLKADRKARGQVEIIKVDFKMSSIYSSAQKQDPFDLWFESVFPEFDELNTDHLDDEDKKPSKFDEIVAGQNLIERLHEMYIKEMDQLFANYRGLCGLDPVLLKELGVKHEEVKKGLRLKIDGTKNLYWKELFSKLKSIKQRLTKKSREELLEKMRSCGNIDFTADNAYAVVIWVIKNANQYINSQLIDMFRDLTEPECIKNYKSNLKTWEKNGWRYNKEDHTHYTLDYRIITERHSAIYSPQYDYDKGRTEDYDHPNGLSKNCHDLISDIATVANNLGFCVPAFEPSKNKKWSSGKPHKFYMYSDDDDSDLLMEVKGFKNGNLHLKFNQNFIKTLNIEASRLLGWIRTPREAADETGVDFDFACKRFKSNHVFEASDCKLLTA